MQSQTPNATLVERRDVADALAQLFVAPDSAPWREFEPGQFTNLGLELSGTERDPPGFVRRAYSMASHPLERARVEFYVRRVPDGSFTQALFALRRGGRLWLDDQVYGRFTLEPVPPERDVLFVASGTGVAPFVSMLRRYAGRGRWRRAVLIESARSAGELGYRAELEALAARDPSFTWWPTLTREPADSAWSGTRGRIQTWLEPGAFERRSGVALRPESLHAFLCGNPAMLADVGGALAELGFRPHSRRHPGELHAERYW